MRRFYWYILVVIVAFIANQCANSITAPSGGPKDETPPVVLETLPENGRPNFKGNKFSIRFNEYISLQNVQQSALISPPMKEQPDFKVKGKTVQVKFNEELKPNTTYSVYFGDAITDITENNPISNYTYIFSTGDYVDSLSLFGSVNDAFTLLPVEGAFVMLYKDINDTIVFDSLPYYVVPYYVSKTDTAGHFQFTGLSDEEFMVFSLLDQNSNMIFDQPGEQIAFLDSLVRPGYIEKPKIDTITADSIYEIAVVADSLLLNDSIVPDSTLLKQILQNSVDLYMFLSPDTIQRLLKAEVVTKNEIRFSFSQPALDVMFEKLRYPLEDSLIVTTYSDNYDTITWFLNNPPFDSLELLITQYDDTLSTAYLKIDPKKQSARSRKKDEEVKEYLLWKTNINSNVLNPEDKFIIEFAQPFVRFNNIDSSLLVNGVDSTWNPKFNFTDSLLTSIEIPIEMMEDTKYRLFFPDSAFSSWNNIHTEKINVKFRTLPISDYGIFILNLHPEIYQNYIVQMMDDKENILFENLFNNDTTITYDNLLPAQYLYKIIFDDNGNGKWDPGNFGLRIQPEKVIYYQKEVKIRANWDVEEDWWF